MDNAVMKKRRPNGKPVAWKKLPRFRPESEYPEDLYKLRIWLREEIKDCRERAAKAKWYADVTKDDPPGTLSHAGWVEQRRKRIQMALDARRRLRETNRG